MTEIFEAPPIGGENPSFSEVEAQKENKEKDKKNNKFFVFIFVIIGIIFFSFLISIFLFSQKEKKLVYYPSPTPFLATSSATPSFSNIDVGLKIENFQKNLEKVDLTEDLLVPPSLDFKIRFKIND